MVRKNNKISDEQKQEENKKLQMRGQKKTIS